MVGIVAVSLTLTSPYVFRIAKAFLIWLFSLIGQLAGMWNNTDTLKSPGPSTPLLHKTDEDETTPLCHSGEASSNVNGDVSTPQYQDRPNAQSQAAEDAQSPDGRAENLLDILKGSEGSREAVWKLTKYGIRRLKGQCESPSMSIVVISIILFGLFVAQTVAGVFSANIASDRAGLAASENCGIWQFDDSVGDEAADLDDLHNYQKEARASQYARACYNQPDTSSPFSCRTFFNQSITFDTKTDQPCPFPSSELCSDGPLSAVTFDTGLIDASIIGINAYTTHKFRRTTSCSPLNRSEPYVTSREDENGTSYQYYYGPKDAKEYTFSTSGYPFNWPVPVYSVK